jgi:hypothetical protein
LKLALEPKILKKIGLLSPLLGIQLLDFNFNLNLQVELKLALEN